MMRPCVLVLARDATLRSTLARWLMPAGYSVELAENDRRARQILADRRVALSGVVARTRDGAGAPIFDPGENGGRLIIASERPQEPGRLTRSAPAADAYLSLPLDEQEVLARVESVLRSPSDPKDAALSAPEILAFDGFAIDTAGHSLRDRDGNEVPLTRTEFAMLAMLARHAGRVLSRDQLLDAALGRRAEPYDRSVDVLIGRLRRKIEPDPKAPRFIVTMPGEGYKFAAQVREIRSPAQTTVPPPLEKDPGARSPSAERRHLTVPSDKPSLALIQDATNDKPRAIEKRQLTIISCELIGAAALAARLDPEDLSALMAAFYEYWSETVARFGGVVAGLATDEMLAYFGYPHAHEHDAEQAVRTALALIGDVRRLGAAAGMLSLRLGIATGPVVVGAMISSDASEQGGLVGETLNLATALRRIAEPSTAIIAASTRRLVGDLFELRRVTSRQTEAFGGTIDAFEVLRPGPLHSRFEALHGSPLTPLVGREEELELLLRRWRQATSGVMRVVLVSGEPGIGKSRLAAEVQRCVSMERHAHLLYSCSPHHQDSALYPVIRQFEVAAGFERNQSVEINMDKLKALITQASAPEEDIDVLAEMLSLPFGVSLGELTPRRKRELTFEAVVRQIDAAAQKTPLLMIFEDVHWSDPTTLELLELVIQRLAQRPILILITFRAEFVAPWIGQPQVTSLMLRRLDRGESAALVRAAIGADVLTSNLVEEVADRADGIPLFLEELGTALAESEASPTAEATAGASRSPAAIPATLQASLMERFDRLDGATREVAQVGAAIGREFTYELVAGVCGELGAALDTALENLVASSLAFRRGMTPNTTFLFKHGLVQDAIYSTLLRSKRQRLHADIAATLEQIFPETLVQHPELLGHHFTKAGKPQIAMRYWRIAVER